MKKSARLDRILSNLGYGTRKEMAMAVKNDWVEIDGVVVNDPSLSIDLSMISADRVTLDGKPLDPLQPFTIMLHKPIGYTCSKQDASSIIYDLLPEQFARRKPLLSPVGRLDKYSSGQLLLTDDGGFLHRVTHPKTHAPKHYKVVLRDDLKGNEADLFSSGEFRIKGEEKPLKPAEWTPEGDKSGDMVLHEGRFHQIRLMFDKLGNEVVSLHRYQTGDLEIGDLKEGEWRVLSESEVDRVLS